MKIWHTNEGFLSFKTICLLVALLSSQGCGQDWRVAPLRVDQNFGNAVVNVSAAQIYDQHRAKNPNTHPPEKLDGVVGQEILKSLRTRSKVKKTVRSINIDKNR